MVRVVTDTSAVLIADSVAVWPERALTWREGRGGGREGGERTQISNILVEVWVNLAHLDACFNCSTSSSQSLCSEKITSMEAESVSWRYGKATIFMNWSNDLEASELALNKVAVSAGMKRQGVLLLLGVRKKLQVYIHDFCQGGMDKETTESWHGDRRERDSGYLSGVQLWW